MPEPERQDDVEIVTHYAEDDALECVQALLLLAGYEVLPPTALVTQLQHRRRAKPGA